MTARFVTLLAFFCIAMSVCVGLASDTRNAPPNPREAFTAAYASAKQPVERRTMVIDAIDSGVITRGMTFSDLKELFAGHLTDLGGNLNAGKRSAVVFFSPVILAKNPIESARREGWYIDFKFSNEDTLNYYGISNLHKYTE